MLQLKIDQEDGKIDQHSGNRMGFFKIQFIWKNKDFYFTHQSYKPEIT